MYAMFVYLYGIKFVSDARKSANNGCSNFGNFIIMLDCKNSPNTIRVMVPFKYSKVFRLLFNIYFVKNNQKSNAQLVKIQNSL